MKEENYVDSLTPEEREQQYNMKTTISTATSIQPSTETWEEQFDKEVDEMENFDVKLYSTQIKQFISKLLEAERERIVKIIKEMNNRTMINNERYIPEDDIINLIKNK
jgi:hypothetical protein